ncbi:MAG TPA: alpha/beta fold hydrolase [Sphingomicrobium sp.]|jgi:dipeptidyl aminopeptidase/acylaminoacyl peptidase|nr:alpha/beta fold hydrolase [Sphingomicrobium sp.]
MRKFVFAAAMLVAAGQSPLHAEQKPALIPVGDFAALPVLSKPLLSPDGRRIAARRTTNGKTVLVILDADNPEAPGRSIGLGDADIAGLRWAGNQRMLLTVESTGFVYGIPTPFLRLLAIDVDTGLSRLMDGRSSGLYAGDVLYADPSGNWALVASQNDVYSLPSVKRVDLSTGVATIVEKPRENVWDWYADDRGIVRAGVAYDDRKWTVWYRDRPGEKLRKIRGKFDKDDEGAVDRFIFRGANSWIMTNERTGRFGLYKYDVASGAVGAAIYENPEVDIDDVIYDPATGEIAAVNYEDDREHVHWLDPDLSSLQEKLQRALPDDDNVPIAWSDDKKRVLVWSQSGSDPGRYFLLDRTSSRMHPVVDPYPRIDPALMAPVKPVRFTARDGLELRGYLTLPKGREPRGLPLVLMPHGGPFDRDHFEYDPVVQFLANRGYAVLQPEFRGSTGFGKSFVEKGYGEWGRKMQDDLDDSVSWLASTGQIDPKRVCIVGASYGGYASLWGAIRNPERYRCAASLAGVSDLDALLKHDRKLFTAPRYYRDWRKEVSGEGRADLKSVSPISFASTVRVPLLIGHGEKDERVPSKQSHDMVEALTKAHADVTSVFYKESGHGFDNSADLEDWLRRLEAFLAKYNPA